MAGKNEMLAEMGPSRDGKLGIIRLELRRSFPSCNLQTDSDHCMENGALSCLTWLWIADRCTFPLPFLRDLCF